MKQTMPQKVLGWLFTLLAIIVLFYDFLVMALFAPAARTDGIRLNEDRAMMFLIVSCALVPILFAAGQYLRKGVVTLLPGKQNPRKNDLAGFPLWVRMLIPLLIIGRLLGLLLSPIAILLILSAIGEKDPMGSLVAPCLIIIAAIAGMIGPRMLRARFKAPLL